MRCADGRETARHHAGIAETTPEGRTVYRA